MLIPCSVETHGQLGVPKMLMLLFLGVLAEEANGGSCKLAQFVLGLWPEVVVGLCKFNAS
jgi:hypothetical protein